MCLVCLRCDKTNQPSDATGRLVSELSRCRWSWPSEITSILNSNFLSAASYRVLFQRDSPYITINFKWHFNLNVKEVYFASNLSSAVGRGVFADKTSKGKVSFSFTLMWPQNCHRWGLFMASCLTWGLPQRTERETLKLFIALNCFLSHIESWIKASGTFPDDAPFHWYILSCDLRILMRRL